VQAAANRLRIVIMRIFITAFLLLIPSRRPGAGRDGVLI